MREVTTMKSNSAPLRAQSEQPPLTPLPTQFALQLLTRKGRSRPRWSKTDGRSSGFTLIESLVAIIILSITVVSVIPPIFWATATRVQNRRAEQAIQLAQSEIDRVRVAVERKNLTPLQLPPKVGAALKPVAPAPTTIIAKGTKLRSAVPGCNRDDGNQSLNVTDLILVDTDPEAPGSPEPCKPEFMIQTFRGTGVPLDDPGTAPDGFVMGVRVYSIVAANNTAGAYTVKPGIQAAQGTLRGSNGLGTQQSKPLATQYSTIIRANKSDGLGVYRQLCAVTGETQACAAKPGP
jgi:prepilin-type N-terminal cleavage/methylation domain-containing protein